jgi:carboxypeptidase C (cathepsin A)
MNETQVRNVVRESPWWAMAIGTALMLMISPMAVTAQEAPAVEEVRAERLPEQAPVTTQHQIQVDGETLSYSATTGYLPLHDDVGLHLANIHFTYYQRDGVEDPADRPITFMFNGGPGAASVWLHLGLGPRRVLMRDPGVDTRFRTDDPHPPPFELVDNEYTWLDETDLVFVDPVNTGYSRAAVGQDVRDFLGYTQDVEYLSEWVRLFVSEYERWASPKFLAGESYGTTRVSGMANHLQTRGMHLNGVILVSAVLNFQTLRPAVGNDLPAILFLPSFAATAWYHDRLEPGLQSLELEDFLAEVEEFVLNDYTRALMHGDLLPEEERREVAARAARYTGLSTDFVEQANLRLTTQLFAKELRRDERRTVGRLDGRFVGLDRDAVGQGYEFDASYDGAIMGPFTGTVNDYFRRELELNNNLEYFIRGQAQPWDYSNVENRYLNVAEDLRRAMSVNPYLQVMVQSGYYDLATPYFAMDYTVANMQLDPSIRENIRIEYYESGHMMYIHMPDLVKMKEDAVRFYRDALQR